jgi:hypothetical protein
MMIIRYLIGLAIIFLISCTIKPPDINVTSERTVLENQLFGEKWKIDDSPLNSAAVWHAFTLDREITGNEIIKDPDQSRAQRVALLAQIRRKTLQPYIDEMKKSGIIGENYQGDVVIIPDSLESSNDLVRLVDAENSDRSIIRGSYAALQHLSSVEELKALQRNFAEIAVKLSPSGTWIQDQDGNWTQK